MPQSTPVASVRAEPAPPRPSGPLRLPRISIAFSAAEHPFGGAPGRRKAVDARWVAPGTSVTVCGFEIPGGMVYLGEHLPASPDEVWSDTPAPCLIRPKLKVAAALRGNPPDMGYWPSYSEVSPEQRHVYLRWLAGGKRDTLCPLGYPFLYFYGLERRLLVDAPPPAEEARLVAEVERLRALLSHHSSFVNYSSALLDFVRVRPVLTDLAALDAWQPDLLADHQSTPVPLQVKLGMHALRDIPVPHDLAIAAMVSLPPYGGGVRRNIAVTRARPEFVELVRRRMAKKHPEGFPLQDRRESRLRSAYRPAAQHLHVTLRAEGVDRIPDPLDLDWSKLQKLCEKASEDLAPFARALGKGRTRDSVEAAALLPKELGEGEAMRAFRAWLDGLPRPLAAVPLEELGLRCFGAGREVARVKLAREMSAMLARMGYGMEPDPNHGGERPGVEVVLFAAADAK